MITLEFDDAEAAVLLDRLGLDADTADVDLIKATLTDALRAAPLTAETPPSQIAAAAGRHGMELLDKETLSTLRHDATEGRKAVAAAAKQRIEATVDDAVSKGKITPARKRHWITLIEADPGMADVLASVPNETAFAVTEVGHSTDVNDRDDVDKQPSWFW